MSKVDNLINCFIVRDMNKKLLIGLLIVIVLVVIFVVKSKPSDTVIPAEKTEPVVTAPVVTAPVVKEFAIVGSNYAFAPATMTVKKGDTVRITLIGTGWNHDLRIDEFNVKTKIIKAGEQDVVEFFADKAGTFEYYCSVGSHRAMGMKGTLTVTE